MTALPEAAYNIPMPGLRGKYGVLQRNMTKAHRAKSVSM
jgi:hypothetical protein